MYGGTSNDNKKYMWQKITLMNKNLEIYGVCQLKTTFGQFLRITYGPIIG